MGFFDIIGTVSDIIGIYDPILVRLKGEKAEYNNFLTCIKKIVKSGCDVYKNFLSNSPDHRDINFHDDYEIIIYNAVVDAIEKNIEFNAHMILPNETDFPFHEKERLFNIISIRLKHYSLEYLIREQFIHADAAHKEQLSKLQTLIDTFNRLEVTCIETSSGTSVNQQFLKNSEFIECLRINHVFIKKWKLLYF